MAGIFSLVSPRANETEPATPASFTELTEMIPKGKAGIDGTWSCHHGLYGLSCRELRCRYYARMLEAFNRHLRLATESRQRSGECFPPGCYLSPKELNDEEAVLLATEWQQIQSTFEEAGLMVHKTIGLFGL